MEAIKKEVTVYVSTDNKEFSSASECKKWETHLKLSKLHQNLLMCDFHSRCVIVPYFHNSTIMFIGNKHTSKDLAPNNSYLLMGGRMGNGDDRVRYKLRGSTIAMLRYSTDSIEQTFLCSIPSKWIDLSIDDLKTEVDKFVAKRNIGNSKNITSTEPNKSTFNVYTIEVQSGVRNRYDKWSNGLEMHIQKDGKTISLNGEEIEKLVKSLPRTIGGRYA